MLLSKTEPGINNIKTPEKVDNKDKELKPDDEAQKDLGEFEKASEAIEWFSKAYPNISCNGMTDFPVNLLNKFLFNLTRWQKNCLMSLVV